MYLFLLKKALPFTLTFVFGAALGSFTGLFGSPEKKFESVLTTRTYEYGRGCRTRSQKLVAESKPLTILYKPDAIWPRWIKAEGGNNSVPVFVTFGADGKVQKVEPARFGLPDHRTIESTQPVWDAVEKAARQIKFSPEVINGVPVTVEKKVDIHLFND